jgi:hypothetical protein
VRPRRREAAPGRELVERVPRRLLPRLLEPVEAPHQQPGLRRRAGGAAWRPGDRLWPTALSRCLPRSAWHVVPVHPATLRRWHRGRVRGVAAARRVPRPPLRGTWSTAAAGAPPSATRVSRVRVPVAGGQRGLANEERRTGSPWWVGTAWQRPGDRRGVPRPGRLVPAACRGRAPPTADGQSMRGDTGPVAPVSGGSASCPHERRAWPAETDRLSAA